MLHDSVMGKVFETSMIIFMILMCHALLQVIFPTQGLNSGFPHCRQILFHLSHQGSPIVILSIYNVFM